MTDHHTTCIDCLATYTIDRDPIEDRERQVLDFDEISNTIHAVTLDGPREISTGALMPGSVPGQDRGTLNDAEYEALQPEWRRA